MIPVLLLGFPTSIKDPSAPNLDDPPPYSHVVFDEEEFHKNMGVAFRTLAWEKVEINGNAVFSSLSEEEKRLLWDLLKDHEVNFNPFVIDLALKLAESEFCTNIEEFIEFLKFVILHLRTRTTTSIQPSVAAPVVTQPIPQNPQLTQAEFMTNQPQVAPRDCGDTCLLCCLLDFNTHNPAPPAGAGGGDGCCDCSDCDCDCDCDACDCDCF